MNEHFSAGFVHGIAAGLIVGFIAGWGFTLPKFEESDECEIDCPVLWEAGEERKPVA